MKDAGWVTAWVRGRNNAVRGLVRVMGGVGVWHLMPLLPTLDGVNDDPDADAQDHWLQIGGASYKLAQYHFHAPSEHAVIGQLADIEAHAGEASPAVLFVT